MIKESEIETCWITININEDSRTFRKIITGPGCIDKARELCKDIGINGYFNSSLNTKNNNVSELITYFPPYRIDKVLIEVIENKEKNGKENK